jgi:hypothetical protein
MRLVRLAGRDEIGPRTTLINRLSTTGIADCCGRAASGHAAAAPRSVMSSRRFIAQCLRASTEKDSTTGGSAAVRDFDPVYVR